MKSNERELLRKLGEETIYSAKGHFKACDLRRKLITFTIWTCVVLNIIGLIGINEIVDKWISALALFGSVALLLWNEGEGKNYRAAHKLIAEKYLSVHKEIREYYFLENTSKDDIKKISNKVISLDKSSKLEIPSYARKLAKKAIESNDPETDNWFYN